VFTTEEIPAGAFVCELVGQYVYGHSVVVHAPRSSTKTSNNEPVTESLVRGLGYVRMNDSGRGDESGAGAGAGAGLVKKAVKGVGDRRVTPVSFWEDGMMGETAVSWAERSVATSLATTDATAATAAASGAVAEQKDKDEVDDGDDVVIIQSPSSNAQHGSLAHANSNSTQNQNQNQTNSILPTESSTAHSPSVPISSNPYTHNLSKKEMDTQIKQFLDGELCIDSRFFGNVARFIKHRSGASIKQVSSPGRTSGFPSSSTSPSATGAPSAIGGSSYNNTINNNSSISYFHSQAMVQLAVSSGEGSKQSKQPPPMLTRRLVYNDAGDMRYPKLALFAARRIPANTELML
jgi:SET domain